jgi:hypothetical protein
MIQQGQVFKLKTRGPYGQRLWAYRYRLEGRGSERPQVGGFATRADAEKALRKVLDRLGPGGGRATITLAEFVDEYLEMHQAARVTIAKLRWLLGKATAELGEKRLADLAPRDVYAWRLSVPRDTALRRRRRSGKFSTAPSPGDCSTPTRPSAASPTPRGGRRRSAIRNLAAGRSRRRPARAGVRADGDHRGGDRAQALGAIRARAARRRPSSRRRLCPPRLRQRSPQAHQDPTEHAGGSATGEGAGSARPAPGVGQPDPVSERPGRKDRLSDLRTQALAAGADQGRDRPRSAASTTCATPTLPSRFGPGYRSSRHRVSWARASR